MTQTVLLGPWVRRFLLEHLVGERNLARNTQQSYRDTLRLLLPFTARRLRKPIDGLHVEDLSADHLRDFLRDVETQRGCSIATRNQRLAAIHSLAHFIGLRSPEHVCWCGQVRAISFKRAPQALITYLEKAEMDALLEAPDRHVMLGRRDHALLLFLYNTGARADEVAHVRIADLDLGDRPERDLSSVLIHGKGSKRRRCPLWARTVKELMPLVSGRDSAANVFLNRRGQPLTRFGIHTLVERYAAAVAQKMPSVAKKRVSPHTIRHTTATHLLRAGVDVNTIRAWLGHVSISTTNVYAEVDLETKAKALASCEVEEETSEEPWRDDAGLMEFLKTL
ncbi:MAG TPA: tyrosine-type recombinase/integrase [Gemmataceae bacterium]|nr:tyrosine-type recombinase/integrase [Gemmataceae bacterium]